MTIDTLLQYLAGVNKQLVVKSELVKMNEVQIDSHRWSDDGKKLFIDFRQGHSLCVECNDLSEVVIEDLSDKPITLTEMGDYSQGLEKTGAKGYKIYLRDTDNNCILTIAVLNDGRVPRDHWGIDYFHKTRR